MPLHLNPLSKDGPSDLNNHESDLYLLPALGALQLRAMLLTPLNAAIYCGPPSTHPGIAESNALRHKKALLEDDEYRITSCVGSHMPEVGEEWVPVAFVKYKLREGRKQAATNGNGKGHGEEVSQDAVQAVEAPAGQIAKQPAEQRTWAEGTHVPMVEFLWPRMLAIREKYDRELGNYLFVDILATDPDWQRMGAGKMLMEEVCNEADRRGWPAWLEGTQEGVRLYEKMGFVGKERIWVDLERWKGGADRGEDWDGAGRKEGEGKGWYELLIMVREPKPRKE